MHPTTIDQAVREAAQERPDELALVDAPNRGTFFDGAPHRLTWAEVDRAVDSLATQLASLGAGPEVAVAVQLPNVAELVLTILACGRTGAVCVPFPIQHRRHELDYGLRTSEASIFVTGARPDRPDQLETVAALADELDHVLHIATFGDATTDGASPLRIDLAPGTTVDAARSDDEVLTVCWTSGTTGTPKGVPRTPAMWLTGARFQIDNLGLDSSDRILCPFPLVNMAGIGGMLVPWTVTAATLVLHQPLDLPVFLQQLVVEEITYTVAPPALLNMLLANEAILADVDLSKLRKIASGAAPLDPWMVEGWNARGIEIVNIFGSNEGAAMLSTAASVPDPTERARSFPRPSTHGIRARLVDLDTEEEITEPGRRGELRLAGPTIFDGYLGSTGEEFDSNGFFRTGDVFEWTDTTSEPWLLGFVDRAKDIIIRGGMNISAAELEGLISSLDSVGECAAVGYADATLGERVGIFVAASEGGDPDLHGVLEHLREIGVASYKLPERFERIDALPRNPLGKVLKHELRDLWAATEA
jgi:acyl-CoA synthetase (AMP-forming)/AMP-acid ligase II